MTQRPQPMHSWSPGDTLQALLDPLPFPLAVLEGKGTLAYCNQAWKLLAVKPASGRGPSEQLVAPGDIEGSNYVQRIGALTGPLAQVAHHLANAIPAVLAGDLPDATFSYQRPQGREATEAYVGMIPSAEGRLAVVQHRTSAQREQGAAARAAALMLGLEAEELRAQTRRLGRRMEQLAQEVHAPITPIRLELHLLSHGKLGPLTEGQRRALAVIERNIQRWIQGEHAFLQTPLTGWSAVSPLDLEILTSAVVERRRSNALQQGVRLRYNEPDHAVIVRASPDLVFDLLDLLVDRAISATPADAEVQVTLEELDGEAVLSVNDAGEGLSGADLQAAFEPWKGKDPSTNVDSNLSLYRVRNMIQSLGGRVWAKEGGPGRGLAVGIVLPLVSTPALEGAAPHA